MIGRRDRKRRIRPQGCILDQGPVVALPNPIADRGIKSTCPSKRLYRPPIPDISVQVVDNIAATEDEDALVPQRRQTLPYRIMEFGRLGRINAQLHHGHIGIGKYVAQDRPCTVIEPPRLVGLHGRWRQ